MATLRPRAAHETATRLPPHKWQYPDGIRAQCSTKGKSPAWHVDAEASEEAFCREYKEVQNNKKAQWVPPSDLHFCPDTRQPYIKYTSASERLASDPASLPCPALAATCAVWLPATTPIHSQCFTRVHHHQRQDRRLRRRAL